MDNDVLNMTVVGDDAAEAPRKRVSRERNGRSGRNGRTGRFGTMFMGACIGVALIVGLNFAAEAVWGKSLLPRIGGITASPTPTAEKSAMERKIQKIYTILDKSYVDPYDKEATVEGIYAGLVSGIGDPYTQYMTTEQYDRFIEDTEGVYVGIGVVVEADKTTGRVRVVSPFEGGPGAAAGILPKDLIMKVDGEDVFSDDLDGAVRRIKGDEGTEVTITVYREDESGVGKTFDMTITRETITTPTVSKKMLENDIGYLRITMFERVTAEQFKQAYKILDDAGMKGLIIDLRNNPGGLVNIVVDIADQLVPKGIIVYTEDKDGKRQVSRSDENYIEIPLLILVNGNSASASEILAGAVKDHGVGELIGTTTFGKGLVQNIFEVGDGSAVKVTIARYYTPAGVCVQGTGIEPDHVVEMSDELSARISSITMEEDVQLTEAVRIMNEKLK